MRASRVDLADRFGHPDIVVWLDRFAELEHDWLLAYFEEEVQRGVVFRPGETVQIGWMVVMLKETDDGALELWEPLFTVMPIEWTRGADNTLRCIVMQQSVCEQLGVEPDFPSILQAAVVAPEGGDLGTDFILSREEDAEGLSGWLLHDADYSGSSAELRSLFEIALACPATIPFLALPAGSTVARNQERIAIAFGGVEASSTTSDFLRGLLQATAVDA